jgi:hypothetical protein
MVVKTKPTTYPTKTANAMSMPDVKKSNGPRGDNADNADNAFSIPPFSDSELPAARFGAGVVG